VAVRWLILREALLVGARGRALGVPLAFLGVRALLGVLQGVEAFDLASYGLAIVARRGVRPRTASADVSRKRGYRNPS